MRVANLRQESGKRAFLQGTADIYVCNYEALMTRTITLKKPREPNAGEKELLKRFEIPYFCYIKDAEKRAAYKAGKPNWSDTDKKLMSMGVVPEGAFCYDAVEKSSPGAIDSLFKKALKLPFDTLIIDESSKAKSPDHKGINQLRVFMRNITTGSIKRRWALTGTPAPNSLMDLFAQVRLVDDGQRLGRAFDLFKQTYFKPSGFQGYQWKELPGSKEAIESRIHDITLTLRSKDWLDIPDTVVEDIDIHLPPKLIADYKAFEKELVLQIRKDKEITATNAAALVSKLLQFTSGSLYDEEKKWHDIHELKLDALAKIAKETKSPILVAYAFQHESHRIRARFPQARFFADAKNANSQTQLLADWNDKKIPMLVAHPKSVGHGLNLQHGGNTLVWMSLTYSREDYEQMIARLSRRGQDALVNVYRLMVPDTVDFAVATVIEEKRTTEDRLLTALQLLESCREAPLKTTKSAYMEGEWI
jgi:hypothetical protein